MEHTKLEMTSILDDEVKKRPARGCWKMGCRTFLILAICGVISLSGLLLYLIENDNLDATVHTNPCAVRQGEQFSLELVMSNIGTEDIYVRSIIFDNEHEMSIFDGAKILETKPEMLPDYVVSGDVTFQYDQIIPAGQMERALFVLEATDVGEFGGLMTVGAGKNTVGFNNIGITVVEVGKPLPTHCRE